MLGKIDSLLNVMFGWGESSKLYFLIDRRFHPEWMPEPSNDEPVPSLAGLSNHELKKVFIGMYNTTGVWDRKT